jgi:hypothetical protein
MMAYLFGTTLRFWPVQRAWIRSRRPRPADAHDRLCPSCDIWDDPPGRPAHR